jgi:hypothetical protein
VLAHYQTSICETIKAKVTTWRSGDVPQPGYERQRIRARSDWNLLISIEQRIQECPSVFDPQGPLLWFLHGHVKIGLHEGGVKTRVKDLLSALGAEVVKDIFGAGDIVAIMEASIHDRNQILGGRVGVQQVVKLGVLVLREGRGQDSIGCAVAEEGVHVVARVTLGISRRFWEPGVGRKKGRVVIGDRRGDRVEGRCASTFCGGGIETGGARKALTRVGQ